MENRYKIILSNNQIYREIELSGQMEQVKVGTGMDCDIRMRKDMFFEPVELLFVRTENDWAVYCSDNLYITEGDIRKLMTKSLVHGDVLEVKYQESDLVVFSFEFLVDFNESQCKYDREINLSGVTNLTIGTAPNNNIVLGNAYVKNDAIVLTRHGDAFVLDIKQTTYGVYVNGKKIRNSCGIKNMDFVSISDYFFYYKDHVLWTQNRSDMLINGVEYQDADDLGEYPKFNRNTRIKTVVCDDKIEILDPPAKMQKPKNDLFMRLLPSVGMLLAAVVFAFLSGPMIIMSAISGVMAIVTTVIKVKEGNKEYKTAVLLREQKYGAYIEKKRAEIEQCRAEERTDLEDVYPSQQNVEQRLKEFSSMLFDRTPEDDDYLCVRLGSGDVQAQREIDYKKKEQLEIEDELQDIPEALCAEYKNLHNAPVVCDLKEVNAAGIVGTPGNRFEMMKNMVVDIVARQYFSDVKLFFVATKEHKENIQWLRFLPHVYNEVIGSRNLVCDEESKNLIFEYLYKELTYREQTKKYESHMVVFFYDDYGFRSHPISKFVDKAKDLGVTFIFFGAKIADVPQGCGYIVDIKDNSNASLIRTENKNETTDFTYTTMPMERAEQIVQLLAPVFTEEISLEGSLTKNITLFELLNIIAVDDLDLGRRWASSQVHQSMTAPLGVSKTGVVSLDLHDKAHGPHGLVAGTTGSGKSEILQTYVLAMATLYHPYEVSFVIIDFKGGGMANQFKGLPHLLGAITNIDDKAINRSLKSIKAELQKRQRYFADADVNHIDKYILKYKKGEVLEPLPHLIIIVDEFAELKAEHPEFMKELISAARIGRSLGVHLILATQKPSGQVNEQIWSNSRFKLCLKVQSQEDSNEVLKSPLAAEIKEPGRAYLQVGNNEIFELFQSAYSGASEQIDDAGVKEFSIYQLMESGKRNPVYVQKKKTKHDGGATQLDAIVEYVATYCDKTKVAKLPDICLPPLQECVDYNSAEKCNTKSLNYEVSLGIYDAPERQYQGTYSVEIGTNNMMIIGSSQSGKTNLLQTMIRELSSKYTPEEVNIYIIDFASMVLKNFEKLNHVGGVVCPSEDEKLKNLFKLLKTEIAIRKEKMMELGVSSFATYKEAGKTDMPLIVLMIDNLTALKELYLQEDEELLSLCREGLTVGISIIIANAQTAGIGYKYLANFSSRIALFCNDTSEYGALFDHCGERIASIPGRSIVELDKQRFECQIYQAFQGEKEIERVQAIRTYVAEMNQLNEAKKARQIPLIPALLTVDYVKEQFGKCMENAYSLVAGLDYATVMPYVQNFASMGLLSIIGREGMGRHTWLKNSIDMLEMMYPGQSNVYVVDGIGKKLVDLKDKKNVVGYSMKASAAIEYVKEMEKQLRERYEALVAEDESVLVHAPLLVLVVDNSDALIAISEDMEAVAAYRNMIGRYKDMKVCMIVFADNATIPYSAPEVMKHIRDQRNYLFFDDLTNMKIFDVPMSLTRIYKKPVEKGDAYYIKDNECIKIKTAK